MPRKPVPFEYISINWAQFACLPERKTETNIDGHAAHVAYRADGIVLAVWYIDAKVGSFCANYSYDDPVDFAWQDPHCPYTINV